MTTKLDAFQNLASKLLAKAILDVFPGSQLVGGYFTNVLFHYEAILPQKIDESMLCLLEERMRALIKEKPEVRTLEMVPQSASEYFRHHGQDLLAELILDYPNPLVTLVEIGAFKDICYSEEFPKFYDHLTFKLLAMDHRQQGNLFITHIIGSASLSKDELKEFAKTFKAYKHADHRRLGADLELFTPYADDEWVWLPRGELLKQAFMQLKTKGIKVTTPRAIELSQEDPSLAWHTWLAHATSEQPLALTEYIEKIEDSPFVPKVGLLNNAFFTTDVTHTYCLPGDLHKQLIYSLQFLDKIIKIFGFEMQWRLRTQRSHSRVTNADWDHGIAALIEAAKTVGLEYILDETAGSVYGPKLEALIPDALGQSWACSYVQVDCLHLKHHKLKNKEKKGKAHLAALVTMSVWGSFERFIALVLENQKSRVLWPAILQDVQKKINYLNEE